MGIDEHFSRLYAQLSKREHLRDELEARAHHIGQRWEQDGFYVDISGHMHTAETLLLAAAVCAKSKPVKDLAAFIAEQSQEFFELIAQQEFEHLDGDSA